MGGGVIPGIARNPYGHIRLRWMNIRSPATSAAAGSTIPFASQSEIESGMNGGFQYTTTALQERLTSMSDLVPTVSLMLHLQWQLGKGKPSPSCQSHPVLDRKKD